MEARGAWGLALGGRSRSLAHDYSTKTHKHTHLTRRQYIYRAYVLCWRWLAAGGHSGGRATT